MAASPNTFSLKRVSFQSVVFHLHILYHLQKESQNVVETIFGWTAGVRYQKETMFCCHLHSSQSPPPIYLHLVQRLRMHGVFPPSPYSFMEWEYNNRDMFTALRQPQGLCTVK
jgi:hypothetical protein